MSDDCGGCDSGGGGGGDCGGGGGGGDCGGGGGNDCGSGGGGNDCGSGGGGGDCGPGGGGDTGNGGWNYGDGNHVGYPGHMDTSMHQSTDLFRSDNDESKYQSTGRRNKEQKEARAMQLVVCGFVMFFIMACIVGIIIGATSY